MKKQTKTLLIAGAGLLVIYLLYKNKKDDKIFANATGKRCNCASRYDYTDEMIPVTIGSQTGQAYLRKYRCCGTNEYVSNAIKIIHDCNYCPNPKTSTLNKKI